MTEQKRKLIFLWTYAEWGGAQIYLLAVMKRAKEMFDIVVILPRKSMPEILNFLDKIDVRYEFIDACLDASPAPSLINKIKRQWRRIHAEISAFRYLRRYDLSESILHIEAAPWQSWIMLTALAMRRAHIFTTMHNIMPRSSRWRELIWKMRLQFVSRLPRFHIFPSNQDTKLRLKGWVSNKFFDQMEVTYTAVNPDEINVAATADLDIGAMRREHGLEADKFIVLCVGQFIDRKGRWIFLDAAKRINAIDKDISFVWMTPKMPSDVEKKKIADYELGNAFKLVLSNDIGSDRHEILQFFRVADAFALVSFVEGLPISLLEAMALGLPSISTNINAIPEAVINEKTGILIEAGDSKTLAEAIIRLKNVDELRSRLAKTGREFVLQNFDERAVARIIINSYKRSLSGI